MTEETLTERFEASRPRLHAIATRMLGSSAEADDAVQETWLRASRAGTDDVDNVEGWLTTITSRVCLDVLRSRTRAAARAVATDDAAVTVPSPEEDAVLADAIGPALLVVLDTLTPPERLAFVLHDLFAVPFDEVAAILQRSPAAARQLASRARRRVQGADVDADPERERPVVDAFLAAARTGDFAALVDLLDPDAVFRSDDAAVATRRRCRCWSAPAPWPRRSRAGPRPPSRPCSTACWASSWPRGPHAAGAGGGRRGRPHRRDRRGRRPGAAGRLASPNSTGVRLVSAPLDLLTGGPRLAILAAAKWLDWSRGLSVARRSRMGPLCYPDAGTGTR